MIELYTLNQKGKNMKLFLSLIIVASALFAGGDILPVRVQKPVVQKPAPQKGCYKPNIKKCPDCEDVAELCPYNGEDLPLAKTEPCEGLNAGK